MTATEPTLHQALAAVGWRSEPAPEGPGHGRLVYDADGLLVGALDQDGTPMAPGPMTAGLAWAVLRSRGLVLP